MAKAVYRAKQGLACSINGNRYHFSAGDLVLEDHPVRPGSNANFEPIEDYVARTSQPRRRGVVIEEATADPGEKRRVGRPRGRKPKETPANPVVENVAPQAQEEVVNDGQE